MNEKGYILSKIEMDTDKVISTVVREQYLSYDEVEIQFKKSVTYQLFQNLDLEFCIMKPKELLEMWKQEQKMDAFLDSMILHSNNKLVEISTKEIKDNLKRAAFLEKKSIDVVYFEVIDSKENEFVPKKRIKETTPYQK